MKDSIVEIYLNFRCNQRCVHCFNSRDFKIRGDLEFNQISRMLIKGKKDGGSFLSLLGGEPTIHPDIIKIVFLAKRIGYRRIITFSNGLRYSDYGFTRLMKKAGLTATTISVFGHNPFLHESITRVSGSFGRVLNAISNLKRENIGITIILVLNKLNYKFFPDIVKFFLNMGIKRYMFFALKYQGRMVEEKEGMEIAVKLSLAFKYIDEVKNLFKKRKIRFPTICHVPPCILRGYVDKLDSYNKKNSIIYLQDGEKYTINKADSDLFFLPDCIKCKYYKGCSGIDRNYVKLFGTEEFKPVL